MYKANAFGAVVGLVLIGGFLGFLGWWLKSWPLSIIIIFVLVLMIYDIIKSMREINGNGNASG